MLQKQCLAPDLMKLLAGISSLPQFKNFYLVGGTALALQLGHRKSVDLDFFTEHEFNAEAILESLGMYGIIVIDKRKHTLNLSIENTKVDIIRYNYPLLSAPLEEEGIRLFSLPDIAAAKISAVTNRGSRKDFYDIFELLKRYTLTQMLGFFTEKFTGISPFMALKSLTWFEDAEEEPDPIMLYPLAWEKVKVKLMDEVKKIS